MSKKIFISILLAVFFFIAANSAIASGKVNIYFFWAKGCPHCAKEKIFLTKIKDKYPQVEILDFDITASRENIELMEKIGKNFNTDVSGIPFTVIGNIIFPVIITIKQLAKKLEK